MLAAEGELARAQAHRKSLLGFGVQFAELVHHDRALLGEAVAEVAGQRERQPRVDERGNGDAANGIGHGSWDQATSISSICGTSVRSMPVLCDQLPRKTTVYRPCVELPVES